MKKCILILPIFFVFSFLFPFCNNSVVFAQTTYFARIKYSNSPLFKSASNDTSFDNVFFYLPQTYFVEIENKVDQVFYQAKYLDQIGYVRKSDIEFVKGTPSSPYADKISFRVFAQNGLNLRSSPVESEGISNRLTTIPFLETNLQYIGAIDGEEVISNRGNTWYFCNYFRYDEIVTGYVYAGYCDMLGIINQNTETLEIVDEPNFEQTSSVSENNNIGDGSINQLNKTTQIIIIVAVCLPAVVILYLLFKPTKIVSSATKKSPEPKRKKKRYRGDYYEIED